MRRSRVIPCLLLSGGGLVKTVRFRKPSYVGDPINAVKIFNEKEVDELVILDIDATKSGRGPDEALLAELASEAFMPIAYGGGVASVAQAQGLASLGIEKIILDSAAIRNRGLVGEVAARLGSSSTLVAIDVMRDWCGRAFVYDHAWPRRLAITPAEQARQMVAAGAGEIMLNDANRDGTGRGLDGDLIAAVAGAIDVPLIACGGAGTLDHLAQGIAAGASAVAAGSQFVYMGPHRAVMINYPEEAELVAVMP